MEVTLTTSDHAQRKGTTIQERLQSLLETSDILQTLTAECMQVINGSNPENAHVVFAVGCAHHKGVSDGVPVEWLSMYFRSVWALRKLGIPEDRLYCLICYDIAGENKLINEQERSKVLEIAGWHMAVVQRINSVAEKLGLPKIQPILDGVLRRSVHWRRAEQILAKGYYTQMEKSSYVRYQTTLVLAFYLSLCEQQKLKRRTPHEKVGKICVIKVGWSTVRSHPAIIRKRQKSRTDRESEEGLCEALADYSARLVARRIGGKLRIGYVYGKVLKGLSRDKMIPYTASDTKRMLLQRTDDDLALNLLTDIPDVTKGGGGADWIFKWQRYVETLLELMLQIDEVLPTFFESDEPHLWKRAYRAKYACGNAIEFKISEAPKKAKMKEGDKTTLGDRAEDRALATLCEAQARIVRPLLVEVLHAFAVTQSQKESGLELVNELILASLESVVPTAATLELCRADSPTH